MVSLMYKLRQNHPGANKAAVAAQQQRGDESQRAVAALMRARNGGSP
jgi:hypothetical protein